MSDPEPISQRRERLRPAPLEIQTPFSQLVQEAQSQPRDEEAPPLPPVVSAAQESNQDPTLQRPQSTPSIVPEQISPIDEMNMKILIAIRHLVMVQPLIASFGASLVFLLLYLARSANFLYMFSLAVPSLLLLFAAFEILTVCQYVKQDIGKAITYNLLNKGMFFAELVCLDRSRSNPSLAYVGFTLEVVHLLYFVLAFLYKRKKAIYHYMLSVINPLIIVQIILLQIRLQGFSDASVFLFLIPSILFCASYLCFCLYFSVVLCREICQLDEEDAEHEENQVQIKGFASILFVVITTNLLYLGLITGAGFYLEQLLSGGLSKNAQDHSFTIFLVGFVVSFLVMVFIWVKRKVFKSYFSYRFIKSLNVSKEPVTPTKSKFRSRLLLRMSSTFFNRDDFLVKKQLKTQSMVKKFTKDIHKEPDIQDSPSRIKRYCKDQGASSSSVLKFKRMDSMQDIFSTPNKHGISESKLRRKASSNKVAPISPDSSPRRKERRSSVIISNFGLSRMAIPDLPSPKKLRLSKQIIQREISKKMSSVIAKPQLEIDPQNCMICHEKDANAIVEPCLHGGCCTECAIASFCKGDQRCVLCRKPIEKIYRCQNVDGNLVKIVEDITPALPDEQEDDYQP